MDRSGASPCWRKNAAPWSISQVRPCQTSRLGLRGVRSTLVVRASNQTRSAACSALSPCAPAGREGQRAGQEVHAEVGAHAGQRELLDLDVRLGLGQVGVELSHDQLGDEEAQCAGEFAGHDLGDQCRRSLPGPGELHHVETVVVGLDQRGQRAALAQRGDVAGGGDLAQRHGRQRYPGGPTR